MKKQKTLSISKLPVVTNPCPSAPLEMKKMGIMKIKKQKKKDESYKVLSLCKPPVLPVPMEDNL